MARFHLCDRNIKLHGIMPGLHGRAGEFVYVSGEARNNYDVVIDELNNRFRIVETTQFNHRHRKQESLLRNMSLK